MGDVVRETRDELLVMVMVMGVSIFSLVELDAMAMEVGFRGDLHLSAFSGHR